MAINSLNTVNLSIKKNIILSLVTLLTLSLLLLNIIYINNLKIINQQNHDEIVSNFDLLKSYLSEKISIIASSNAFVDYLRSGPISQQSLKSDFIFDIRSLKLKEISGMKILSSGGEKIFSQGVVSPYFINLPLCYFDRGLDSKLGACSHNLILYLNMNEIIQSLKKINENLVFCKNCTAIDFLSDKKFGSFNIANAARMPLFFEVKKAQSFNIITVNLIVLLVMVILASWTWRRTNSILDKYLSNPLKTITSTLKSGAELVNKDEINELAYLVNQIQDREDKLKRAKENDKLVIIGYMASQVAHDIRSPLDTLIAIVEQMDHIPEEQRLMMNNLAQQINDIADNILSQYNAKSVNNFVLDNNNSINTISVILDSIIAEKKVQYNHLPITIQYNVSRTAQNLTSEFTVANFKRVISNVINNAFEAIQGAGNIIIELDSISEFASISITDSGIGMKADLIRKILNGESISCKKGGVGIGLASSIKFIRSWGGKLDIASQPHVGTTIWITIPTISHEIISSNVQELQCPDLILIDDNKTVTDAWHLIALRKQKKIVIFNNVNDVNRDINNFDRATPIYIDSNLGDLIRGEQYAKKLYEEGFINIYLTTGYKSSSFLPMYWIKGIIGKEPIF